MKYALLLYQISQNVDLFRELSSNYYAFNFLSHNPYLPVSKYPNKRESINVVN